MLASLLDENAFKKALEYRKQIMILEEEIKDLTN